MASLKCDENRSRAIGEVMTHVERYVAEVLQAQREQGIRWLVIEHDENSRGWFLYAHSSLSEASEFDSWHESRSGAQRQALDRYGIKAEDWSIAPETQV